MKYAALIMAVLLSAPMTFSAPEMAFAAHAKKVCRWQTITRRVWRNGRPHIVTTKVKRCFVKNHS